MPDFEDILPQGPSEGPPLPKALGVKWPGERKAPRIHRATYVEVARIVSEYGDTVKKRQLVEDLADMFAEDNPLFDYSRFRKACSVG